tara:strand:- start:496 stop:693 length:198 start_codon:yes stop_codon:yes gene_type:complete
MIALIAVLDKLLYLLLAYRRKTEKTKAQNERDTISKNPASWFTKHFSGGVSKQSDKKSSPDKTDS